MIRNPVGSDTPSTTEIPVSLDFTPSVVIVSQSYNGMPDNYSNTVYPLNTNLSNASKGYNSKTWIESVSSKKIVVKMQHRYNEPFLFYKLIAIG